MFKKDPDGRYDGGSVMLTVIGPEAYFHGVITVRGSLRIEGEVEGNVHEANEVTVGTDGRIQGDVCAQVVTVSGTVEGSIVAHKQLEIKEGGKVTGNIRTGKLLIEEGAVFEGNCVMKGSEAEGSEADGGASEKAAEEDGEMPEAPVPEERAGDENKKREKVKS